MPPIEQVGRYQLAVLWPALGTDSYGQPTIGDPVELMVRWNDVFKERLDPQSNTLLIEAEVIVDRDVAIGSVLWKGSLDDLPGTGLTPPANVFQVKGFNGVQDIKGRQVFRKLQLMRFRDTLPTKRT